MSKPADGAVAPLPCSGVIAGGRETGSRGERQAEGRARMAIDPRSPTSIPTLEDVHVEHIGFICRSLRGLGVAPSAVEDAAQEVLLVVHRRLQEFEPRSPLRAWLFTIASHVARNYRRASRRRAWQGTVDLECPHSDAGPEQQVEAREALRLTEHFMDGLDEGKRAVFVLALIEGLPASEVAAALGLPMNTVYSRIRLLRQDFRQVLEQHHRELLR